MNPANCEDLDRFLSDDLSAVEVSCFESHLFECERCREAVDQQQWIDGLLRSPLVAQIEAPPAMIVSSVASRAVRRRRQMRFIACGLAAAAAVVVAVGWTVKLSRQADGPIDAKTASVVLDPHELQQPLAAIVDAGAPSGVPRATFVGGPDVLVVPVESRHPNVTIVQIYPTYEPDYAAQATAELPTDAEEFSWPFELNGG